VRGEGGRDFYVRQLHDLKGSADIATTLPIGLTAYARLCGVTLARAHARGGDVVAIDAYLGTDETCTDSFEEFAQVYADQAEQDYGHRKQAIYDGKIPIHRPVSEPPRSLRVGTPFWSGCGQTGCLPQDRPGRGG
jgi:Uncharacterized protein conserved in bacteria (DUF2252)